MILNNQLLRPKIVSWQLFFRWHNDEVQISRVLSEFRVPSSAGLRLSSAGHENPPDLHHTPLDLHSSSELRLAVVSAKAKQCIVCSSRCMTDRASINRCLAFTCRHWFLCNCKARNSLPQVRCPPANEHVLRNRTIAGHQQSRGCTSASECTLKKIGHTRLESAGAQSSEMSHIETVPADSYVESPAAELTCAGLHGSDAAGDAEIIMAMKSSWQCLCRKGERPAIECRAT